VAKDNNNAQQWLAVLDSEDYEACWNIAAEYFRNGVPLKEWVEKATDARQRVGQLQTRTLKRSVETDDLPAAPAGKYLVNEYASVFSQVGEIGERLTLQLEDDGQMRVVGYYLI